MTKISKKELILNISAKHFAKYGYDGTVLDNIAKECNLTKPAIYYHFKNKNILYKEIICTFFTKLQKQIYSKTENKKPIDALESYVKIFGEFFLKEPEFSSIFAKELSFESPTVKDCAFKLESILKRLYKILDDGYRDGVFEKQNPFLIQLMIVSTLTNYHTTKSLREYISQKSPNLLLESRLEDITEALTKNILKAVKC